MIRRLDVLILFTKTLSLMYNQHIWHMTKVDLYSPMKDFDKELQKVKKFAERAYEFMPVNVSRTGKLLFG